MGSWDGSGVMGVESRVLGLGSKAKAEGSRELVLGLG